MNSISIGALVAAGSIFCVSAAGAAPVFEMRIQSGSYDSGIIVGTVDGAGTHGILNVSGLSFSSGGNSFDIGSIHGAFDNSSLISIDLSGTGITHTSNAAGALKITMSLFGLDNPGAPVKFTDSFAGSFASTKGGNGAQVRVYAGKSIFKTSQQIFSAGKATPVNPGSNCTLPTSLSYSCDLVDPAVLINPKWATYALTQVISLNLAAKTLGASVQFSNHLADPIPEPGSLALMFSGILAAAGFGFRSKRNAA